jgi:hypothetical protein
MVQRVHGFRKRHRNAGRDAQRPFSLGFLSH